MKTETKQSNYVIKQWRKLTEEEYKEWQKTFTDIEECIEKAKKNRKRVSK